MVAPQQANQPYPAWIAARRQLIRQARWDYHSPFPFQPDAIDYPRMETPRKWHAVSIVADGAACRAALALADLRYLSAEAPRLPLDGCDKPGGCQCRYRHHPDRRVGPRRAVENFRPVRYWQDEEKRLIRGRRSTDYSTI